MTRALSSNSVRLPGTMFRHRPRLPNSDGLGEYAMNQSLSSLSDALPACQDCQTPISRVENRWHQDEDGRWRLRATMVCPAGHRVLVEPF